MRMVARHHREDPEAGTAGKVLLIVVAIIVLLGVAGVALWNPVIRPLIGEAVPVRVTEDTTFEVPFDDPQVTVTVPEGWTMQRALYNPQQALLRSPDLGTHVLIDTWKHGASPTMKTAITQVTKGWKSVGAPLSETYSEELVGLSVVGSEAEGGKERLIVVVGSPHSPDSRAAAVLTVTTDREQIDEVLPAVAQFISHMEVPL